ncbi:formyltransferase family protein [Planktomarina temperata]|nr:formyltransferase family protein [Planktomarina temperata]
MENKFSQKVSVIVVGCVESTKVTIEALLKIDFVKIYAIITTKNNTINSDYLALSSIFSQKVRVFVESEKESTDNHLHKILMNNDIDICFVVGWSRLISLEIFEKTNTLAIGYHPALLPKNRGRHPIIWSIVLGIPETGSTFFELAEDADSGAIINQKLISIGDRETSRDLYDKLLSIIPQQINEIINDHVSGTLSKTPQDHKCANYWRKRNASDGLIDWRMSARSIDNLVRALMAPYPGADFMFNAQIGKILNCLPIDYDTAFYSEPGLVLDSYDNSFVINTGDGALLVKDYTHNSNIIKGDYL